MTRESLPPEERQALLDEVRSYLPAFLKPAASVQEDPAGDVRELLDLEEDALSRVVAVHGCLDPAVLAFGAALEEGLRHPLAGGRATTAISQGIRGQIDWQQTFRHRFRAPGETATHAVREAGQTLDIAENRALVWLLYNLEQAVDAAKEWSASGPPREGEELTLAQRVDLLGRQLRASRRVPWLRSLTEEKPAAGVLERLRSSALPFYRQKVLPALEAVLRLETPSPELLTAILAERYFRPEDDGTLFEVAVALRLARSFAERSPYPRRARLMMGEGRSSFASYRFDDGSEVSLAYQAWPDDEYSMRRRFIDRHRLAKRPANARPDLMILREGEVREAVILELKASSDPSYLRGGLAELLAYLADRPDLWGSGPAAWLVAPASPAFVAGEADASYPIWIVGADEVAAAATSRFLGD